MKSWKVKLESEAKGCSIAKELVGPNLESEALGFTFAIDSYATIVHNERDLLDEKARIEGDLTWLFQTLTVLTLNSSNPTTDPQIVSVAIVIGDRRKRQSETVSKHNHAIYAQNTQNLIVIGQGVSTDQQNPEEGV